MFKAIKFFAVFFTFSLLGGCASSCGSSVDTNSNGKTNEIIVPKKASNIKTPSNNANTNMVNGLTKSKTENPTLDNSKVKKIDTSKVKTQIPKKKAPDNSEVFAKSVGKAFVETRQFNNHPQLDKVEKIINGRDIKFKVYLKNGKTVDLEQDKLKEFRRMPASDILKAVGVTPVEIKNKGDNPSKEEVQEKIKKKPNS